MKAVSAGSESVALDSAEVSQLLLLLLLLWLKNIHVLFVCKEDVETTLMFCWFHFVSDCDMYRCDIINSCVRICILLSVVK